MEPIRRLWRGHREGPMPLQSAAAEGFRRWHGPCIWRRE